ncbi:hypothetical protein OQA88_4438 [Cercophora sp. LCS_1]
MPRKVDPAVVADLLEQLPLELFEPILATLSFRDIITLDKLSGEGSRLGAALSTDPKWKDHWPMYMANRDGFQSLAFLIIPSIGRGRHLLDPTDGALDVTAGQLHRRLVRMKALHGPDFDYYQDIVSQTSGRIALFIEAADPVTLSFLSQRIPLGDIAVICPGLKDHATVAQRVGAQGKTIQIVRDRFLEAIQFRCRCVRPNGYTVALEDSSSDFKKTVQYRWDRPRKPCEIGCPSILLPHWDILQMKTFIAAYSVAQAQLNKVKSDQLQALAKLYTRHPSRLKEPYAPQSPRHNISHVPNQLEITSRFVLRIVDLRPKRQATSKQGKSKFRYLHPCLIPYDWCLRLWLKVGEANPHLRGAFWSSLTSPDHVKPLESAMDGLSLSERGVEPPEHMKSLIQIVNQGQAFYKRKTAWGVTANAPAILRARVEDNGNPRFKAQMDTALVWKDHLRQLTMLPPFDAREIEWLEAFVGVVEWMEGAYPDVAVTKYVPVVDDLPHEHVQTHRHLIKN